MNHKPKAGLLHMRCIECGQTNALAVRGVMKAAAVAGRKR